MQDIGHDMEELLRKAAEEYPVRPGADRWEEIALAIAEDDDQPRAAWWKRYFPVLLLLALLFGFLLIRDEIIEQPVHPVATVPAGRLQQPGIAVGATKSPANTSIVTAVQPGNSLPVNKEAIAPASRSNTTQEGKLRVAMEAPTLAELTEKKTATISSPGQVKLLIDPSLPVIENATRPEEGQSDAAVSTNITIPEAVEPKSQEKEAAPAIQLPKRRFTNGLYYGIVAGGHKIGVKQQGFKKMGYDVQAMLGYHLNSRLSVETGLLYADQLYWTMGRYFNTKEMSGSMPAGTEMLEVHGSTRMLGFPLQVKYDLFTKGNRRVFAKLGTTSYVLLSEHNRYSTALNGVQQEMEGKYNKKRNYLAATIDLEAGYEISFKKQHRLRLSPYMQLPLQGIGIGQVPIKTLGLRIGFTRELK